MIGKGSRRFLFTYTQTRKEPRFRGSHTTTVLADSPEEAAGKFVRYYLWIRDFSFTEVNP